MDEATLYEKYKKAKQDLENEKNNSKQAAMGGLRLMEQKRIMLEEHEKKSSEFISENEKLKQEVYSMHQNLAVLTENKSSLVSELREELESKNHQISRNGKRENDLQKKIDVLITEVNSLETDKEEMAKKLLEIENINSFIRTKLEKLQEKLLQSSYNDTNDNQLPDINLHTLTIENETLLENIELSNREINKKDDEILKLEKKLKNSQDEINDKDFEISNMCHVTQELKNEILELTATIQINEMQKLDVNKRGNSIFSEVEDHRQIMEKELAAIKIKYKTMASITENKTVEILKLKNQMSTFLSFNSQRSDQNYIKKLEHLLSQSRGELLEMSLKYQRLQIETEEIKKKEHDCLPSERFVFPNIVNDRCIQEDVASVITTSLREELATTKKELESMRIMYMSETNKLVGSQNELYICQRSANSYQSEILKLKLRIEQLTNKSEPNEPKKIMKIVEKLPVLKKENIIPIPSTTVEIDKEYQSPPVQTQSILRTRKESDTKLRPRMSKRVTIQEEEIKDKKKEWKQAAPVKVSCNADATPECKQQ